MIINPGGSLPTNPTITGTLTVNGGLVMGSGATADFHNVNIADGALNIATNAAVSCHGSANLNNGLNTGGNVNIANSGVFDVAAAAHFTGGMTGQDLGAFWAYEDQPPATAGGASTANTWVTRVLNTNPVNTITSASIAANQITLPAGTYRIIASAPAFGASANALRLQNITDGTTLLEGQTLWGNNTTAERRVHCNGQFTLAAAKVIALQMNSSATVATNGFGVASNITGVNNHFSDVMIWKVA